MIVVILLIATGLLLLILEFFVFPGMTISGIGGIIMTVAGVYTAYSTHGAVTGNWVLVITMLATLVVLGMALRWKTWRRFMLKTEISGNVETVTEDNIKPGDKGITVSRLNPVGKARINNEDVEARYPGQFVDPGTEIEVVKVFKTYVIVKPIN